MDVPFPAFDPLLTPPQPGPVSRDVRPAAASDPGAQLGSDGRAAAPWADQKARARAAAEDYESFFLSHMFQIMQQDISTEPPFGGGSGEAAFRSFLSNAYADAVVQAGGVGLSASLASELISTQIKESGHALSSADSRGTR